MVKCKNVHLFNISGNDVVIVKNGKRICGTGAALSNAPIAQDKAYFEVKLQSTGNYKKHFDTKYLFIMNCQKADQSFNLFLKTKKINRT